MLATKTVTTSSGEFTIAPLTLRQVEAFYPADGAAPKVIDLIYQSLLNAGYDPSCGPDSMKDVLSPRSIGELKDAVMDLTGLVPANPGEAPAAETSSTTSTAA